MFIDSFIGYLRVERNYSPQTLRAYANDLRSFQEYLARIDESLTFSSVDIDVVRMWMAAMVDDGATPSTVSRKISALRTFYKFLCSRGHVSVNPMSSQLQSPKRRKKLPHFVKEQDMNSLLDGDTFGNDYAGVRDRMILLCFYSTGMRLTELVELDLAAIDMASSTIRVFGKRSRERIIPFGYEMKQEFGSYLPARQAVADMGCDALFLSANGTRRVSRSAVYRMVNSRLADVTSLGKRSPHVLRHSFATAMLNNNAELGAVKELLGHRRLATTEIYTHLTFEELKRFYNKAHPRAGNN